MRNFLSHCCVPFGTLLRLHRLFDKGHCYKWYDPFTWTLLPLVMRCLAIALTNPYSGGNNKDGPYFFLNVDKYDLSASYQCRRISHVTTSGSYSFRI